MLIKRSVRLQKIAVTRGGVGKYAEEIAKDVSTACRTAKNKHTYQLKGLFFDQESSFRCATGVLDKQQQDRNGLDVPMVLDTMFYPEMKTVGDLHNLLMSSNMHANTVFYPLFVRALAAGKLARIKKQNVSVPLVEFISLNFEAHFRLELWYATGKQGENRFPNRQQCPPLTLCLFAFAQRSAMTALTTSKYYGPRTSSKCDAW